jgi:flavin-dependent dehydrogenase
VYDEGGHRSSATCRVVLDCSGRAGVIARQFRCADRADRMYALVGVWHRPDTWNLTDETHTVVETYDDGWAWSVPISPTTRHVGAMIDLTTNNAETAEHAERFPRARRRLSRRVAGSGALADIYRSEIAKTRQLESMLRGAALQQVFACDASSYSSTAYAGSDFLLVGDAASFIDPLSSFGVKKALASAWLAAVVVHTCLTHPDRRAMALDFFSRWERDAYLTHARRSRDFARTAYAQHAHPFWAARAEREIEPPGTIDEDDVARDPGVQAAFDLLKNRPTVDLALGDNVRLAKQPVIRGREIVLEEGFEIARPDALASRIRFLANVDLVRLAQLASHHRRVPDIFDAYCRASAAVPLPNVLGGLSFLVSRGILKPVAHS